MTLAISSRARLPPPARWWKPLACALTTPATDLIGGLGRLGLPAEITEIALLMYRFLFLLGDTAMAMDAAQAARLGHVGARRRLRSLGLLIANLLPRSLDRARRVFIVLLGPSSPGRTAQRY